MGELSLGEFFTNLVKETGCGIVLDVSHVYSYAIYKNIEPLEVLNSLPLEKALEIHIAGGSTHPNHTWRYRDTHAEHILDDVLILLKNSIPLCKNLKAITYELGVGLKEEVMISDFKEVENISRACKFVPSL